MVDLDSQLVRPKTTHSTADPDIDLDSQPVRGFLLNPPSQVLTPTWLVWTFSQCVVPSQSYSLKY